MDPRLPNVSDLTYEGLFADREHHFDTRTNTNNDDEKQYSTWY